MNDSATTITPELIAELRERYTPPTIPPCRVCGGELSIARVGGGEPTEWACSGKEDDPDRPGWLRNAPGRWTNAPDGGSSEFRADGHYNRSRWTDYRSGGDSGVIAVLDALEFKDQQPAAVDGAMVTDEMMERAESAWDVTTNGYGRFITGNNWRECLRAALTAALAAQPGGSDNDR